MIGVCIKYFHENYGGMLQAYATVSFLEKVGVDYELIRYEKRYTPIAVVKALPRLLNGVLLNDKYEAFRKKLGKRMHRQFDACEAIRIDAFRRFKDTHFLKLSPVFTGYDALCLGAEKYDAVITGSDQLWSPAGLPTNFYNLAFVPDDIRKISIASSFGVSDVPWYQRNRTRRYLNRIEYVSMREERGAQIVKELTGREVPTILDPVFLFDQEGWQYLIPVREEIGEPYIFAYFLGDNPEHRKAVQEAADALNCKIVTLRHLDQYITDDENFGDFCPYDVGPDRFLNILRGAAYVCTDSFHGACFSVIHRKQFVVFDRYHTEFRLAKNSRIDTLCNSLNLTGRRFTNTIPLGCILREPVDYDSVYCRLDLLRKDTNCYLQEALARIN